MGTPQSRSTPVACLSFLLGFTLLASACAETSGIPPTVVSVDHNETIAAGSSPTVPAPARNPTPPAFLVQRCPTSPRLYDATTLRSGSLLFLTGDPFGATNAYIAPGSLDSASLVYHRTSQEERWAISPDGTQILFTDIEDGSLVGYRVVPTLGGELIEQPWQQDWPGIWYPPQSETPSFLQWWDEHAIYYTAEDGTRVVLSLETGELLHQLLWDEGVIGWSDNAELLVYADEENPAELRETLTGERIAELDTGETKRIRLAAWTRDDERLAYASGGYSSPEEIYIYDRHGRGGRVSAFSSEFSDFGLLSMNWSHDGRRLAMWAYARRVGDGQSATPAEIRFYVYAVSSGILADYCHAWWPPEEQDLSEVGMHFSMWGPDDSQLLVVADLVDPPVIIDADTGVTYELPAGHFGLRIVP